MSVTTQIWFLVHQGKAALHVTGVLLVLALYELSAVLCVTANRLHHLREALRVTCGEAQLRYLSRQNVAQEIAMRSLQNDYDKTLRQKLHVHELQRHSQHVPRHRTHARHRGTLCVLMHASAC